MSQSQINSALAERNAHTANIAMLSARAPKLEPDAGARAARTIAKLKQQIRELDDLLARYAGRAAA